MDLTLLYILIGVVVVSLISLIGVLYFFVHQDALKRALPWLVAFAAGALLGASFFDLIPESFDYLGRGAPIYIVAGILLFLVFEQVLHWHHEHHHDCEDCAPRTVGYSIILGDGLHNFLDGVLIASAFLVNPGVGVAATVAVIFHEIPQEIGDFAVLIHSGFSKGKALLFNFLSALLAVAGGLLAYFFLQGVENLVPYVVAVGAGGFLYIALVDLLAEFKSSRTAGIRLSHFIALLVGVAIIFWVTNNYGHTAEIEAGPNHNEEISAVY